MLNRLRYFFALVSKGVRSLEVIADVAINAEVRKRQDASPNPLNSHGQKTFSQGDEDGIIAEILRRLAIDRGVYVEFGVGDGLECNTLALAAQGWKGSWISGEALAFSQAEIEPGFFRYFREWVDPDNVVTLYQNALKSLGAADADVLSFDLDSRDLFFLELLLESGIRPALAVVEYNAKFAPSIRWSIDPNEQGAWVGTDYMGTSLASLVELFGRFQYRLVACNASTGANAFFVDQRRAAQVFDDVPKDVGKLYMTPFYNLARYGHPTDPRTALRCFEIGAAIAAEKSNPEWCTSHVPQGGRIEIKSSSAGEDL